MAGNRVEELEETVRELEATVNGLTDELVECKERIRHLEAAVEPDPETDIIEGTPTRGEPTQTGPGESATGSGSGGDPAEAADDPKEGGTEGTDEEASDGDDIIVA